MDNLETLTLDLNFINGKKFNTFPFLLKYSEKIKELFIKEYGEEYSMLAEMIHDGVFKAINDYNKLIDFQNKLK